MKEIEVSNKIKTQLSKDSVKDDTQKALEEIADKMDAITAKIENVGTDNIFSGISQIIDIVAEFSKEVDAVYDIVKAKNEEGSEDLSEELNKLENYKKALEALASLKI